MENPKSDPSASLRAKIRNPKLIVVLGPTASGKSALAVQLARKFNGEIISADSRQVYKGLNIGTGKVVKREMMGIPHHLLDVGSPLRRFTVAQYQKSALKAIAQIHNKGKLPFLVGGSALYIYAVIDGWTIPQVKPNFTLRKQLERLPTEQLLKKLQMLDPQRAETIEQKNPRRLIRALEIVMTTQKPVPPFKMYSVPLPWYQNDVLFIGIKRTPQELEKRIRKRISVMFKQGLLREVKKLRSSGLSWARIEEFGFGYRFIASYLQKGLTLAALTRVRPLQEALKAKIQKATEDFARRQMTWFKKDKRINWVLSYSQATALVHQFLMK